MRLIRSSKSSAEASRKHLLIQRINFGGRLLGRAGGDTVRIRLGCNHFVFGAANQAAQQPRRKGFFVDHQLLADLFDGRLAVRLIKNHKAARNTDGFAVLAQQPDANTVKSAHVGHKTAILGVFTEQLADPAAHFLGGFVGKSHGQNVERRGFVGGDQIGDAMGQRFGLARAGAGLNQQRSFGGFDGPSLLWI